MSLHRISQRMNAETPNEEDYDDDNYLSLGLLYRLLAQSQKDKESTPTRRKSKV